MKRIRLYLFGVMFLAAGNIMAQDRLYADEFSLGDVTLLDGPLKKARDLNIKTLLQYDCDRLLAPYLKEAGLTPKAKSYPNWDGLDGHVGGHYLTAMAINAAMGDKACRERMEYFISELQACADANAKNHPEWGKGYVGGVPGSDRIWSTYKKGDFGAYSSAWVPFYNIHKMYAGLRDAWVYCGNEQAKQLFLGFCNWAIDLTAGLTDEQVERTLHTEHGGMNEVLADAYAITGDKKYLNVDVKNPVLIPVHKVWRQKPHESGQHHKLHTLLLQDGADIFLRIFPLPLEVGDIVGLYSQVLCPLESIGILAVADHALEVMLCPGKLFCNSLEVGTVSRD